jgi:hypothetical protein
MFSGRAKSVNESPVRYRSMQTAQSLQRRSIHRNKKMPGNGGSSPALLHELDAPVVIQPARCAAAGFVAGGVSGCLGHGWLCIPRF